MKVWLIKDGENLPVETGARKMRMWMLADVLTGRGHQVTWWSSTHSHQRKALFADFDRELRISAGLTLRMLHAGSYRSNRSLRRIAHHARFARRFLEEAGRQPLPGVIVSAFPTIESAAAAARFAHASGVPFIVDIRDPWPDSFEQLVPALLRAPLRLTLGPLHRRARDCFRLAGSIVACSQGFLDWGLAKAGRERSPADRIFYLGGSPRGTRPHELPPAVAALRDRMRGRVTFTFVGSFGHVYQLRLVCEAAEALNSKGRDRAHFILVGDGQQHANLSARFGRLPNLTFTGWLDAAAADSVLAISDVGLAPIQQMDGCVPNKIFEYASAGLPILSSLRGETEAILARHGSGMTYAPGDVAGFLEAVEALADNPSLRRQQAKCSAGMFRKEFIASRIYGDFADHVEQVAGHAFH